MCEATKKGVELHSYIESVRDDIYGICQCYADDEGINLTEYEHALNNDIHTMTHCFNFKMKHHKCAELLFDIHVNPNIF